MALFLVAPAIDLSLEINVTPSLEEALAIQIERLTDPSSRNQFSQRLEQALERLLPDLIDWDIKEPTPSQKAFAKVISQGLGIPVPTEAMLYRGHMHTFLDRNAELFKLQQASIKVKPKL